MTILGVGIVALVAVWLVSFAVLYNTMVEKKTFQMSFRQTGFWLSSKVPFLLVLISLIYGMFGVTHLIAGVPLSTTPVAMLDTVIGTAAAGLLLIIASFIAVAGMVFGKNANQENGAGLLLQIVLLISFGGQAYAVVNGHYLDGFTPIVNCMVQGPACTPVFESHLFILQDQSPLMVLVSAYFICLGFRAHYGRQE